MRIVLLLGVAFAPTCMFMMIPMADSVFITLPPFLKIELAIGIQPRGDGADSETRKGCDNNFATIVVG